MRKLKRAVIKEEFVEVTGDQLEAILLNQILYWTDKTGPKRYKKWLEEESTRTLGESKVENLEGGWIYKKVDEIKEETMSTASSSTIARKLNELNEKGYIFKRKNPKNKWDKTFQYRINALKLIKDLEEHDYHLQEYNYSEVLRSLQLQKTHIEDSINHDEDSTTHNENSKNHDEDSKTHNGDSNMHDEGAITDNTIKTTSSKITLETNTNNNNINKFSNSDFQKIKSLYEDLIGRKFTDRLNKKFYELSSNINDVFTALERCHDYNTNSDGGPPNNYIYKVIKSVAEEDNKAEESLNDNFSDWDDNYDEQLVELIKTTYKSNFEEEIDSLYLNELTRKDCSNDEIIEAISKAADKYYKYVDSLVDFNNKKSPYEFILNELKETAMV